MSTKSILKSVMIDTAEKAERFAAAMEEAERLAKKTQAHRSKIDPSNDDFGCLLNCAVRYAMGRQTYMPSLVIDFISPLIPSLTDRTLHVLDQDIVDQKHMVGYGDKQIDEPLWIRFHELVKNELTKRGCELYKE